LAFSKFKVRDHFRLFVTCLAIKLINNYRAGILSQLDKRSLDSCDIDKIASHEYKQDAVDLLVHAFLHLLKESLDSWVEVIVLKLNYIGFKHFVAF